MCPGPGSPLTPRPWCSHRPGKEMGTPARWPRRLHPPPGWPVLLGSSTASEDSSCALTLPCSSGSAPNGTRCASGQVVEGSTGGRLRGVKLGAMSAWQRRCSLPASRRSGTGGGCLWWPSRPAATRVGLGTGCGCDALPTQRGYVGSLLKLGRLTDQLKDKTVT